MASDKDQENNNKTSQGSVATSLLHKMDTGSRTPEQPNISCVQWKLRDGIGSPEGKPPRLWFIISRHHHNLKIFSYNKYKDIIVDIIKKL